MVITAQHSQGPESRYSLTGGFFSSVVFHGILVGLTLIGMPFVAKEPILISKPIQIEFVKIDKQTQTDEVKKAPPPKAEDKPKKQAEKMTAEAPPDLSAPKPPEFKKEIIPKDPATAKPAQKPKQKPKPPEKVERKPPPPEKEQDDLFSSLLKNLAPDAQEDAEQTPEEENSDDSPSSISNLGEQLSMSEIDAFKSQIAPCWNVPSGAKYAENLLVEVRVFMNQDQTVRDVKLLDRLRYNMNSHYRAAADSALRALRNPRCQPFELPVDKYEQWKEITIRFDPREML